MWARLPQVLLEHLHAADEIDWSWASPDSASVPAETGAIEIELAGGHRVRVPAGADLALLRGVLAALTGR